MARCNCTARCVCVVDGTTITGQGTETSPFVAAGSMSPMGVGDKLYVVSQRFVAVEDGLWGEEWVWLRDNAGGVNSYEQTGDSIVLAQDDGIYFKLKRGLYTVDFYVVVGFSDPVEVQGDGIYGSDWVTMSLNGPPPGYADGEFYRSSLYDIGPSITAGGSALAGFWQVYARDDNWQMRLSANLINEAPNIWLGNPTLTILKVG